MRLPTAYFVLLLSVLFLAGCQAPGPVELQETKGPQVSDVQPLAAGSSVDDTTGLIAADQSSYFAQLIVSGVRSDAVSESHTLSLAHAVFFDKTQPILQNGNTLGYQTIDVGRVFIDGLPLYKVPYRLRMPSGIDTVVGVQYGLLNRDGIGGRGFTFIPSHRYVWTNADSNQVVLNVETQSARALRILRPTPYEVITQRQDLLIQWTGGETTLHLIISVGQFDRITPVLRMKIRGDRNQVIIPAKVMELLPTDRSSRFVFTFVSQTRSEAQAVGFPDKILVHSASIHNIHLTVQQ